MLPRVDTGADPGARNLWTKRDLRRSIQVARAAVPPPERAAAGRAIAARVLGLPIVAAAHLVAGFAGHRDEPDTLDLLDRLVAGGKAVLLPVLSGPAGDPEPAWAAYGGRAGLVPGRSGVPGPPAGAARRTVDEADLVLVPGVAFDRAGGRLGRGGGWYDRALARVRPGVPVVGLAYDVCVVDAVPMQPHDRTVDLIVTPTRLIQVS